MGSIEWTYQLRFVLALLLGLLTGLERETVSIAEKQKMFAGIRTYSLFSLLGFGAAWFGTIGYPLVLPAAYVVVGALAVVAYITKVKEGHIGLTSEVAAIITFTAGALCVTADVWIPMALGIVTTFILSEKTSIEKRAMFLDKKEFLAVIKFLILTVIVLPMLPNEDLTQFKLNPAQIWKIVILVSSIGFLGYFAMKKLGSKLGMWVSGLIGGIVSSTAVSVSAGRIARAQPQLADDALKAATLASGVMYVRVLILLMILNQPLAAALWWKLLILLSYSLIFAFFFGRDSDHEEKHEIETPTNPFEIKPALLFAVLFVVLSIATTYAAEYLGNAGIIALAGVIGMTDVDPFILSAASQQGAQYYPYTIAILIALMSNTMMKGIYFGTLAKSIRKRAFKRFIIWGMLHIPLLFL